MDKPSFSRRELLIRAAILLAGAAVGSRGARADNNKADRSDYSYQDKPKNGKSCSSCRFFTPDHSGKGYCDIVDGEVHAYGWCMAYSQRKQT